MPGRGASCSHLTLFVSYAKLAWEEAKRWYRAARDTPAQPSFQSMAKQTEEREELYSKVPPPGGTDPDWSDSVRCSG